MQHIFDSHAHYFDGRFLRETEEGADALLDGIMPEPVEYIINVGTNCKTSAMAVAQAARHKGMLAAVGIHPEDCHSVADPEAELAGIREMLRDPAARRRSKIVALGEIGLDYHAENYSGVAMDKEKEMFFFRSQLEMARELGLPVIIHDREAHGDCFETVLQYPEVRGVFHSYSGSPDMARELVRRGWYISFSGTLSFRNAPRVREAALAVPRDRLLIETDAPYLAPHPMRGRLNHSGLLVHTLAALAELWGISPEEAACITAENAKKLFFDGRFV